jgi:hypothetical protein
MTQNLGKFRFVPIKDLLIFEENPRDIYEEDFQDLISQIQADKDFFTARPCLVNQDTENGQLIIYAGAQRFRAAKQLGYKEIHCFVNEDLQRDVMLKRSLLDNHHYGRWDFDKLANNYDFEMLQELGRSFMQNVKLPDMSELLNSTEEEKEVKDSLKEASYVIKYEIVFDNEEQQSAWYELLAHLKANYKDCDTQAQRIHEHIKVYFNGKD